MELPPVKQQAQQMLQGAARGKVEEERELSEPACPAERLMIIIGFVSIVPLQMSNLPRHVRFATNSVDDYLGSPWDPHLSPTQGHWTKS